MGRAQRDKGARAEREFARLINGERVPLSGAAGGSYIGDVVGFGLRWEVKRLADGFRELYKWLDGKDALAVRADRKEWLVVIPLGRFMACKDETERVDLKELRNAANEIIEYMRQRKNQLDDGSAGWTVNWASLYCTQAVMYVDDEGYEGYLVEIEEADPGAYKFAEYVSEKLREKGFQNVEVRLEW